jgi:hypothetical protein
VLRQDKIDMKNDPEKEGGRDKKSTRGRYSGQRWLIVIGESRGRMMSSSCLDKAKRNLDFALQEFLCAWFGRRSGTFCHEVFKIYLLAPAL